MEENAFENAARILYGGKEKEENEEKKLRNTLLNELGDNLTPAQILYSTNEDLKKLKEEKEAKPAHKARLLDKIKTKKTMI